MAMPAGPALAQSGGTDGPAGYDEAEAQAIDRMLMCPVCPAESIDQAQVPQARQMRARVRELLADGATRRQVLDWFRERYGPGIVAEPPRSGFNLIAWIVPAVAIIAALTGGTLTLRAMRRRGNSSDGDGGETGDLQPYLAAVDRDLALPDRPTPAAGWPDTGVAEVPAPDTRAPDTRAPDTRAPNPRAPDSPDQDKKDDRNG